MKIQMRHLRITIAALLFAAVQSANSAEVLSSTSDFQRPTSLITFESFPNGDPVPYISRNLSDQWASLGVRISNGSDTLMASAYSGTYDVPPHSGINAISGNVVWPGDFLEFSFTGVETGAPGFVTEVGLWLQNGDQGSTVSFFSPDGALIQSLTLQSGDVFAGLRATEGIARLRVTDPDYFLVDDLQFSQVVPEPSSSMLFALGAGAVYMLRRNRLNRPGPASHSGGSNPQGSEDS